MSNIPNLQPTSFPDRMNRLEVIDSHTGGEPTRVIVTGGPDLGFGNMAERRQLFRTQFDAWRSATVCEPRGSDVLVGTLLCPPVDPAHLTGVIFFNNVGYLGMCVHGMIGVLTTLAHLRWIEPGAHRVETPAGIVSATLHEDGRVTVANVPSYRSHRAVTIAVDGIGPVTGDVAWGGNWFFLIEEHRQRLAADNVERLTEYCWRIRQALERHGVRGDTGAEVDHVELFGPGSSPASDSKNFVLCPGKAYDRSPCGTGTSAKLACLSADGKLAPGQSWRQESIIGSVFEATYETDGAGPPIVPHITGRAFVTAETTLVLDEADPFRWGLHAHRDVS